MPADTANASPRTRLSSRKRAAFLLVVGIAFLFLLEVGFRLVYSLAGTKPDRLQHAADYFAGKRLTYFEPWPYVGFRLTPSSSPYLRDDGFTSTREISKARTPSTLRIAFIGGSTTQGSADGGYLGSYPYLVQGILQQAGLPVETLNCGVSAWTSVENLIHFELTIQDYKPDWVVIHQGANDVETRLYREFRSDYGHARRAPILPSPGPIQRFLVSNSRFYTWVLLRTRGIPADISDLITMPLPPANQWRLAPEGVEVFRRNTETLIDVAQGGGARILLTTESHNRRPRSGDEVRHLMRTSMDEFNEAIREIARRRGLPLADTEIALDNHGELFTDYVHVLTKGNEIKAHVITRTLLRAGLRDDPRIHIDEGQLKKLRH